MNQLQTGADLMPGDCRFPYEIKRFDKIQSLPISNCRRLLLIFLFLIAAIQVHPAAAAPGSEQNIAGTHPDSRPAGAPLIKSLKKDSTWWSKARSGVTTPYPPSLRFLESQGAWYSPFVHPGMASPYDLRHWFSPTVQKSTKVEKEDRY